MQKKGDLVTLVFLSEMVAAIFIVYMAAQISVGLSQGRIYEKLNVAKDLAMQINTLAGVPGDVYIVNKNLHGYSVHFIGNRVEVLEDDSDRVKGIYYFVENGNYNFDLKFEKPEQIIVEKTGNEIRIYEQR